LKYWQQNLVALVTVKDTGRDIPQDIFPRLERFASKSFQYSTIEKPTGAN
jgi:hypothetical protein